MPHNKILLTYKGIHIAAISDTHGNHRKLMIPDNTEIIVHCGDACSGGFYSLSARPWLHCREDVPYGADILITHGAPFGILDDGLGCPLLSEIIVNREIPIHLFGHIHSNGNRSLQKGSTIYYNVAELDNSIKCPII